LTAIPSAAAAVCSQEIFQLQNKLKNIGFCQTSFAAANNMAYFIRPPFFDLCECAVKAPTVMIS
jgi:hypothetical protein